MPRHRGWSALQTVAYYAGGIAVIVIGMLLIGGCATSKEIELTQRVRDLEVHLAGAQDDQAMLMKAKLVAMMDAEEERQLVAAGGVVEYEPGTEPF